MQTIQQVIDRNLCTGCGTCISFCPQSSIKLLRDDSRGIYVPYIKEEDCKHCGLCTEVCAGYEVDFTKLNQEIFGAQPGDNILGNYQNCFTGHSTDQDIRYNSSSGGMVTALLVFALEKGIIDGALVTKMSKSNPLEPEPFIARSKSEIISASKSKYCPVPANVALEEILDQKGKYAVVGLPCHIHGLRKAEMVNAHSVKKLLEERVVLHIGIFCAKTVSFLGTELFLKRNRIAKDDVQKLDYRGDGWPGNMKIMLRNRNEIRTFSRNRYFDAGMHYLVPWRCTLCCDHTAELADISFGDAWIPGIMENDKIGSSIIICRNPKAMGILQWMGSAGVAKFHSIDSIQVKIAQEGSIWKKGELRARMNILRLFGIRIPSYNASFLKPVLFDYVKSIKLYLLRLLFYGLIKTNTWRMVDILLRLKAILKR